MTENRKNAILVLGLAFIVIVSAGCGDSKKVVEMKATIISMEQSVAQKDAEIKTLNEQIAAGQQTIDRLKSDLVASKKQVELVKAELLASQEQTKATKDELANVKKALDNANQKIVSLQTPPASVAQQTVGQPKI